MEPARTTQTLTIAVAGNPNSGKTTLFNALTGLRHHVGNWPGVTVEKKEGRYRDPKSGREVLLVDLPGIYGLGAYAEDERVARDYIVGERPDALINVVDATNLERNLFLTVQLLELTPRVVLALNMWDEVEARGMKIRTDLLSERLGVLAVPTVATKKQGLDTLMEVALDVAARSVREPLRIDYGPEVEEALERLVPLLERASELAAKYPLRWLAVKYLEGDEYLAREVEDKLPREALAEVRAIRAHLRERLGEDPEVVIADRRYAFIERILCDVVERPQEAETLTFSDRLDRILTHRIWGIPIFLFLMFLVFEFTFALGKPLSDLLEEAFSWFGDVTGEYLTDLGVHDTVVSLVTNGIINGVGAVVVFFPPIFFMFLAIALLEDSGYMARAAYVMDRFMRAIGLHGKSFIPMLLGFGCNVPAILATRTLESRADRLTTILVNPFMSCTARLAVFVLLAGAFFPEHAGLVVFSLYLLGIVVAIAVAKFLRTFIFKGESAPFILELPPYRFPDVRSLLLHTWDRAKEFLRKAGTIIVAIVILIWALGNLPPGVEENSEESYIGQIGQAIAPVFAPAGFGTWEAGVALLAGVLAKESVNSAFSAVYGVDPAELGPALAEHFTPLAAYAFMVMTLLYIPCAATIAVIRQETQSWKWPLIALVYTTLIGYTLAVLVYQVGRLLGLA
ncbi:ferrous iron transport protein B [Brockia lithotrophica]|uniref:Ferrous iron transport protein B n=1 Tax=Brockia lithotrophica TaxID=933949 RepID=A0A660KT46_9BACL|nr:ferrous iron transport protein B [Brockia lithotrophica]RKQ83687.1 ferrous iron transport protein B [Brockia lithotrophica]